MGCIYLCIYWAIASPSRTNKPNYQNIGKLNAKEKGRVETHSWWKVVRLRKQVFYLTCYLWNPAWRLMRELWNDRDKVLITSWPLSLTSRKDFASSTTVGAPYPQAGICGFEHPWMLRGWWIASEVASGHAHGVFWGIRRPRTASKGPGAAHRKLLQCYTCPSSHGFNHLWILESARGSWNRFPHG